MLKRGIEVLVGAALMVALLTILPAVAQAQEEQEGTAPASVVVSPGDTLWSISEEHLGPGATPQQIADEVERIYVLNHNQIGPDPNLIFTGQELSLPAVGGSLSGDEAATKKNTAQETVTGAVKGVRSAKGEPANQQANNLPNLPKVPTSAPATPAIGSLANDAAPPTASPVASLLNTARFAVSSAVAALVGTLAEAKTTADGRQLLGWGIIALALLVGALMAWKLPMRRNTGDEKEVWGIYAGYPAGGYPAGGYPAGGYPAYAEKILDPYEDTPASVPTTLVSTSRAPEPEPSTNGSKAQAKAQAPATQKGASPGGLGGIAQKRRRQLARHGSKRLPRKRSAGEAHSTEARRLLRGAVLRARAAREPTKSPRTKAARRRVLSKGGR
jgi:LysM repeat protein